MTMLYIPDIHCFVVNFPLHLPMLRLSIVVKDLPSIESVLISQYPYFHMANYTQQCLAYDTRPMFSYVYLPNKHPQQMLLTTNY